MKRYITTDTRTAEIIHESNRLPWLQPLRQKPSHKPSKRRRPRNDPLTHLVFATALLGGLVMFVEAIRLGRVSFN